MNWLEVTNILKTQFAGPINSSIERSVVLLKQLKWTAAHRITGSFRVEHPVGLTMNQSLGFRSGSTEAMPLSSGSNTRMAASTTKMCVSYAEFEGQTIRATKSDKGSFARVIKNELDSLALAIRIHTNRALYGTGTGELGEIATDLVAGDSATITIRTSAAYATPPNMAWFEVGMHVDIYAAANFAAGTAVKRGSYKVINRNRQTNTITLGAVSTGATVTGLNADCGAVQGDKLVVYGNYMNEPYGLNAIIDDGTLMTNFLGISETSYDRWQSYVDHYSGTPRPLTEAMLQSLIDEVEAGITDQYDAEKKNVEVLLITRREMMNKIASLVKNTTVQEPSIILAGGYKAVTYCGHPILIDRLAPSGQILSPNLQDIFPHQLEDNEKNMFDAFNFDDIDSGLHGVRNSDMYYTKGVTSFQLTTGRRNTQGKIVDIDPAL